MILSFLAFGIALVQVLLYKEVISSRNKFTFAIVGAILSGIPLLFQFVMLLGELARARRYSTRLLLHRMVINVFGSYGPSGSLSLKQYYRKRLGEYPETQGGLWHCLMYVGHGLAKLLGAVAFGDPFSATFTVRHISLALWMDDESKPWVNCIRPTIDRRDIFSKSRMKNVRDLSLTVEFSPVRDESMSRCHIIATGSRDNLLSKVYYESWDIECSIENGRELCTLMEALNDDAFVVKCCPPPENDQILSCEELDVILISVLTRNKKVNARRVFGMSYV